LLIEWRLYMATMIGMTAEQAAEAGKSLTFEKVLAAMDRYSEEADKRQVEADKRQAEADKRFQELERVLKEVAEQHKETERVIKETDRQKGDKGNRAGANRAVQGNRQEA
jgi:predicted phage-related endonuclease